MSVLSRPSVMRLIDQGQLIIDPFNPERLSASGSYTFTIGEYQTRPIRGPVQLTDRPCYSESRYRLGQDRTGLADVLRPGGFVLLETAERLKTPSRIVGWLSTHPSLAKIGLDLIQSSFLVPPGCDQRLVLETSNRGPFDVRLVPGSKAVKIIFLRTD